MNLKVMVGSGDKIGWFVLPFLIIGLVLNHMIPSLFSIGGPGNVLMVISVIILISGLVIWIWSVILIATKVPRNELITNGPYAVFA